MRLLVAVAAGLLLVLAYPPYGIAVVALPAVAAFLAAVRGSATLARAAVIGAGFGLAFFGLLFPWIGELGLVAFVPLLVSQAVYPAGFAALLRWSEGAGDRVWYASAVGGWALMEFLRLRVPVGGFGWGLLGYTAGEYELTRDGTHLVGTSGWSVVLAAAAAAIVLAAARRRTGWVAGLLPLAGLLVVGAAGGPTADGDPVRVAVVQGSSPCPGSHCPDERQQIYATHLALTRRLSPGTLDLVVWPEGSTGSFNADPVRNPEVGAAIAAEARRLGAAFLVGGDRPISDTHWVNANVVWDRSGTMVGEYHKRHAVPFGEYIPARPLFEWIPALDQVPRDMIPGPGPVVFDLGFARVGSVISFESSFARYPRETVLAGADLLVIATSQASYPESHASDQLIGMTRMRSAELGVDLVHASVSGRSTLVTDGGHVGERTPLSRPAVVTGTVQLREAGPTVYARFGDWLQTLAIAVWAGVMGAGWLRDRRRRARRDRMADEPALGQNVS